MSNPRGRPNELRIQRTRVDETEAAEGGSARADARSIPELIRELSQDGADLMRHEVALAKAELSEKVDVYRNSAISMAIGGGLLLAALLLFAQALSDGLMALLAQVMDLEIAVWLAPLILAITLGAIGWGVFAAAKKRMSEEGITPHATKETLIEDRRWASRKVREVKEDMRHG